MTYFIDGLKIIFPIFFIMALGYFARKRKIIDEGFIEGATSLVFYFALPISLFNDITKEESLKMDPIYVAYGMATLLASFLIALAIGKIFIKDDRKLTAFVHAAFRGNFVYIGFPIIRGIMGNLAPSSSVPIIMFVVSFQNILGVGLLTYYHGGKMNFKKLFLQILKNPMTLACIFGFLARAVSYRPEGFIGETMGMLSKLSTPLALILIGGSLNFQGIRENVATIFSAVFIKEILLSAIFIPLGVLIGFNREELIVLYVFYAVPSALNTFLFAKKMGSDHELTSQIISVGYTFSILSFPLGIAILSELGII